MIKLNILTTNENEVLNKKLNGQRLTQVESNYLSRSIRPKLREMEELKQVDISSILQRIQYNQKGIAIEEEIKELVKRSVADLDSIIVYGSAIQTNYSSHNDIDILIITKKKAWAKEKEKYELIKKIKEKDKNLVLDIQILDKKTFYQEYSSSADLIYQLKDSKIVYGNIKIPKKINLSKLDLQMKLDWSDISGTSPESAEIYRAIRNAVLVELLLNKIVDNKRLKQALYDKIGKELVERLKTSQASKIEKKIALVYLNELSKKIREDIKEAKWEKIEL